MPSPAGLDADTGTDQRNLGVFGRLNWANAVLLMQCLIALPKLQDDVTRIKIFYADHGYIRANIPDPIVDVKRVEADRTVENRYSITIKIEEGDQYRVGDVKVMGNKQFTGDEIRGVLGLVPGQVWNETALKNGFENLKNLYGARGYVNFTAVPVKDLDKTKKIANVRINIQEG